MSEESDAFLTRAAESLAGAESELVNERYNNAANRAYFACFHAAVAALALADVRPPAGKRDWTHAFVQGQFPGLLIYRRKQYSAELRDTLDETRALRQDADYRARPFTSNEATRSLRRARVFVGAIMSRGGTTR